MENTTFTKGAVVSFTMAKCREKAFDFSETKRIASEAPDFKGHIFKEVRVAALIEETDCLRESMSEVLLEDSYRAGGNTGSHMCFVVVAL